jgi:hypothetical protein
VTGWIALAGIILTFLTSVVGFAAAFRQIRAVHVLVNSNLTRVMDKLGIETEHADAMAGQLKDAGLPVPRREKTLQPPDGPPGR